MPEKKLISGSLFALAHIVYFLFHVEFMMPPNLLGAYFQQNAADEVSFSPRRDVVDVYYDDGLVTQFLLLVSCSAFPQDVRLPPATNANAGAMGQDYVSG